MTLQPRTKSPRKKVNKDQTVEAFEKDVIPFCSKLIFSLVRDFSLILPCYKALDYQRDISILSQRIKSGGLRFIAHELPILFDNVLCYLEGEEYSFDGQQLVVGEDYPVLFKGIFEYIFNDDSRSIEYRPKALQCLYQVCVVFSKIEGPYSKSVLVNGMKKFIANDVSLGSKSWANLPAPPILDGYTYNDVLDDARIFISELFANFDPAAVLLPQPGSGATNTKTSPGERFRPGVVYTQIHDVIDYDMLYTSVYQNIFGSKSITEGLPIVEYPTSRYKDIPKKFEKPRGICLEESETQFAQQGLRRPLYEYIEKNQAVSPEVRGRINFSDQSVNRALALTSSLTREYATLDMRNASNNVGREQVLCMFLKSPLFDVLEALSTKFLKLPDYASVRTMESNMFAPMGSGICFFIMSVFHFALMRSILRHSKVPSDRDAAYDLYVYGDDLIVPSSCVYTLYTCMPAFGCEFNETKSFVHSQFRESCGIHAYAGYDITPTFVKNVITKHTGSTDSTVLLSLIAKEHSLRISGFVTAATYIRVRVTEIWGKLPWVSYNSPILGWKVLDVVGFIDPRTLFTKCREQRPKVEKFRRTQGVLTNSPVADKTVIGPKSGTFVYEYRVRLIKARYDSQVVLNDHEGYLRSLLTMTHDASEVPGEFKDLKVSWAWVSEPVLSISDRV